MMLQVSTNQIEFDLQPNDERSFYKLQLQNVNHNKNIGFKIRSTNVERYIVSPTTDLLEPQQKVTIDIVLHLKDSDKNLDQIDDKFAIFFLEVEDTLTKEEVEKYLKQNSKKQQKIYIKIKINKHQDSDQQTQPQTHFLDKQEPLLSQVSDTTQDMFASLDNPQYSVKTSLVQNSQQIQSQNNNQVKQNDNQSEQNLEVERKQGMFTSEDNSYFKLQNEIYEKDQHIQKLKKNKKQLELNLQKIQQVIKDQRSFQDNKKPQRIQNFVFFIIFFIGIVIGSLFNSH